MDGSSIIRRIGALALAACLACSGALAELTGWPERMSPGQQMAHDYFERVNEDLASLGGAQVNSIFECYSGFVSLGVTGMPGAEIPEGVELVLTMSDMGLEQLTIRTKDIEHFAALAGACIEAGARGTMTLEEAMKEPKAYAAAIAKAPLNSISNHVQEGQGDTLRAYYNYVPNEYHDEENWMTMTIIFPWGGAFAGIWVSPVPQATVEYGTAFDGYSFDDGYTHLEVVTPPPQSPDDAVFW